MKKYNLWNKVAALSLVGTMAIGLCTGCGSTEEGPDQSTASSTSSESSVSAAGTEAAGSTEITYPIADAGSFTYGMSLASSWSDRYDSYDAIPLGIALENATGYDMEMVHVADKTAMNLLLASGELPDAITYNFASNYTGGNAKALSDGLIYPMSEEFLQENAPDYWAYLNEHPEVMKQVKASDGSIYGFAFILGDELLKTGQGVIIRDDWCKEVGMELPETADEFYNMLKAFKDELGVEIPMSVTYSTLSGLLNNGIITSPFGLVTMNKYVDNGTVKVGYAQEEFKDVLAYLNKLYQEGLFDPNFATLDFETESSNILTGVSGVAAGACGSKLGTWLATNEDVEDYSLAGIRNLVANRGETAMYGHYNVDVPGNMTIITSSCKDPAAVARFFNFGYTEEGHMIYNFGTEGVSYEMVDGEPVFTELITNNPDGLTIKQALSEYQLAWTNGPFIQDPDYLLQYYSYDEQKTALKTWCEHTASEYLMPTVTVSDEYASEYSSLVSELETYRDEKIIAFIRGDESLDNFDSYLEQLQNIGVERYIEILQDALDTYNAN